MSIRWILLSSAEPQVLKEFDASFVACIDGAVDQGCSDLIKRSLCYELPNSLASPLGSNHKVFDLAEHKANFLYPYSPDYKLTMRLNHIVDPTLDNIDASSLE